jgi:hypothetical protein
MRHGTLSSKLLVSDEGVGEMTVLRLVRIVFCAFRVSRAIPLILYRKVLLGFAELSQPNKLPAPAPTFAPCAVAST